MIKEIKTFNPKGEINPPSSKSYCHRYLIGAFITNKPFKIHNFNFCDDTNATLNGLKQMGGQFEIDGTTLSFIKREQKGKSVTIDAKESASTLRMLLPIACYLYDEVTFLGSERLFKRPLNVYEEILEKAGIPYIKTNNSISIKGRLKENNFSIRGDISSQFITGLLFYSLLSEDDVYLDINTTLKSSGYVSMTFDVMNEFGRLCKKNEDNSFEMSEHNQLSDEITIESDYSSASYFIVLGALKGGIKVNNLNGNSNQPDMLLLKLLESIGARFNWEGNAVLFEKSQLKPFKIDISNCIDLGPTLFALASLIDGTSVISGVDRLQIKESNRLEAMLIELNKAGVDAYIKDDKVIISGKSSYEGEFIFNTYNDHRICMALSIFIVAGLNKSSIENFECINKSYPNFFKDLDGLKA